MVSRPTVADVAREAGVSVATVDRVVNARLPVREDTTRRVLDAAHRLGFHATGLIRSRLREQLPDCAIGLLLQKPDDPFYSDLEDRLERAITGSRLFRGTARTDFWTADDPEDIAARLRRLGRRCQAVARRQPRPSARSRRRSPSSPRGACRSSRCCRTAPPRRAPAISASTAARPGAPPAGWSDSARGRPGKVAVIVGSRRFQGHELREIGFRSYFRERRARVLGARRGGELRIRRGDARRPSCG